MSKQGWRTSPAMALVCAGVVLAGCGSRSSQSELQAAQASLAAKEPNAAVIHLKNALQQDPKLPAARLLLGQTLLDIGEPVTAAVELRKALELGAARDSAVPPLARALLAQGQAQKTIDEFAPATLAEPAATADLKTTLAKAYLSLGQPASARLALQAALQAVPDHAAARTVQASLAASDGQADAAVEQLRQVVQRAPADVQAWVTLGDLLARDEAEPAPAVDAYRHALALQPRLLAAHVGILKLQLLRQDYATAQQQFDELRRVLPEHRQTLYFGAVLALQRKDFKTAAQLADRLLNAAPANPDMLRLAGTVALQAGDLRKAEGLYANALRAAPGNPMLRRLLASTYVQLGQPDKALQTLQPLVDGGAADADVLTLAAMAQLQAGNFEQAQARFAQAAQLKPATEGTRTALALARAAGPDGQPAVAELQALAAGGARWQADYALVVALVQRREFARALQAVDALQRKQGDEAAAQTLRGRVHLASGDTARARASFEQALAGRPTYYPACAALAALDQRAGQPAAAAARFEGLLKHDPKSVPALTALAALRQREPGGGEAAGRLLAQAVQAEPGRVETRVLLVNHHLGPGGSPPAAVAAAQDAVAAIPGQAPLVDALGRALLARGDLRQALAAFNQLSSLQPDSVLPAMRQAQVHLAMKNPTAAERALAKAVSLKPGDATAAQSLVALQLQQGEVKQALQVARDLRQALPASAAGDVLEGDILASQRRWAAAADAYAAAIGKDPRRNDVAMKRHAALQAAGQRAEARNFADVWVKAHGDDGVFLLYLGETALAQGDHAQAQARLEAVARMDPRNASVQNNLAWLRLKQGQPGALPYAERANQLQPGQPDYMDTLATVLARENRVAEALALQQKALQLQPADAQLRLHLAQLYLRSGDKSQARAELERLSRLGDKFAGQPEVTRLMKDL